MPKETAVQPSPNKHHGAKVQCLGSTCGRSGKGIAPYVGMDTTTQYSPVLVTRAHGVPFSRREEEYAKCAGRNQEQR